MALSNYSELQAAVLAFNWARDSGSVTDFIALAHSRINLGLRAPFMEKTADITISSYRIAAPSDFAAVKRLWIDSSVDTPLRVTSAERVAYLRAVYAAGRPEWFAIEGDSDGEYFVFAPDPGSSYTGKLLYKRRLPALSAGTDTNVVLARYPNLYVYGALAEAAAYADDPTRLATYQPKFEALLAAVNAQTQSDAYGGSALAPNSPYAV